MQRGMLIQETLAELLHRGRGLPAITSAGGITTRSHLGHLAKSGSFSSSIKDVATSADGPFQGRMNEAP
jgi:hypothetical protein